MNLAAELNAHLLRLGVWAMISAIGGAVLLVRDRADGFGGMTLGWGVINLLIVAAAMRGAPPTDPVGFRNFLIFNLGLNVVWIAIGVFMARSANPWSKNAGVAMVIQGGVLMALDLILFARTGR